LDNRNREKQKQKNQDDYWGVREIDVAIKCTLFYDISLTKILQRLERGSIFISGIILRRVLVMFGRMTCCRDNVSLFLSTVSMRSKGNYSL
jgi:hypothetical protein